MARVRLPQVLDVQLEHVPHRRIGVGQAHLQQTILEFCQLFDQFDTPRSRTSFTASSLNSRVKILRFAICHLRLPIPP